MKHVRVWCDLSTDLFDMNFVFFYANLLKEICENFQKNLVNIFDKFMWEFQLIIQIEFSVI